MHSKICETFHCHPGNELRCALPTPQWGGLFHIPKHFKYAYNLLGIALDACAFPNRRAACLLHAPLSVNTNWQHCGCAGQLES